MAGDLPRKTETIINTKVACNSIITYLEKGLAALLETLIAVATPTPARSTADRLKKFVFIMAIIMVGESKKYLGHGAPFIRIMYKRH